MSLQGIFCPVIRAYFDNPSGGGGGAVNSDFTVVMYDPAKEYECIAAVDLYKVSDLTPSVADFEGAIFLGDVTKVDIYSWDFNYIGYNTATSELVPGIFAVGPIKKDGTPMEGTGFMIVTEEAVGSTADLFGVTIPSGMWVATPQTSTYLIWRRGA